MEQTLLTKPLFGLFTYLGGEFKKKNLTSGHNFSLRYHKALKCWIPAEMLHGSLTRDSFPSLLGMIWFIRVQLIYRKFSCLIC